MVRVLRAFTLALAVAVLAAAAPAARAADAAPAGDAKAKKKIVFIAGNKSHGFGDHEHNAGCTLLAKCLNESGLAVEAKVFLNAQWPDDATLNSADAIVIYCDGGGGHLALKKLKELDALHEKGVGIGMIHYGVEVPKGPGGDMFLKWIGGYFETNWSVNPHWRGEFTSIPQNACTCGVKPFATQDEWYYNMRFRPEMEGVTPILSAVAPDSTRKGRDDAHGGNPTVRAGIGKNQLEHVIWTAQNKNGSRGFGCTGGHFHWNWGSDNFRKTILNTIVWIAKGEVPATGIESKTPNVDELLANQDDKIPATFDKAKKQADIDNMNKPFEAKAPK